MTQQPPDEEFERRLRDVLHSRGLGVPVPPDAIDRIHAGARRRQQRRTGASALGAVAILAIAAVAMGVRPHDHAANVAGTLRTASAAPIPSSSSPTSHAPAQTSAPVAISSPPSSPSPVVTLITPQPTAAATPYPTAGSAVPADFMPVSVTAVNDNTFWILGTQRCGTVDCTAVLNTTDAGAHFTEIAAPPAATVNVNNATRPVFNLRFADSSNGWAYGDALWTTSDGGATWTDTSLAAGSVKDLEAARNPGATAGTAWAVVQPTTGGSYELWQAPYATGSGTGSWKQVDLGTDPPGDQAPSLVVKGAVAYLLAADAKNVEHLYVASVGVTTVVRAAPCYPIAGAFSAGIGSLWTACPAAGTNVGGATVSTDDGATWHAATSPSKTAVGVVGGVDATTAVVSQGSGLVIVSTTGKPKTATISSKNANFSFLGFTDAKVGYALSQAPNQLWRTTNGGATWTTVAF